MFWSGQATVETRNQYSVAGEISFATTHNAWAHPTYRNFKDAENNEIKVPK